MNAPGSARPRSESAANWRAAIQPSVRVSSAVTSSGVSSSAATSLRYAPASLQREAQIGGTDLDQLPPDA